MKNPCLGAEEYVKQTFLKNINTLLGFVQVMLLIDDHLQQLKMWKGGTDHRDTCHLELTIAAYIPNSPQCKETNYQQQFWKQVSKSETTCLAVARESWNRITALKTEEV